MKPHRLVRSGFPVIEYPGVFQYSRQRRAATTDEWFWRKGLL